jgi:hypothetical protein
MYRSRWRTGKNKRLAERGSLRPWWSGGSRFKAREIPSTNQDDGMAAEDPTSSTLGRVLVPRAETIIAGERGVEDEH